MRPGRVAAIVICVLTIAAGCHSDGPRRNRVLGVASQAPQSWQFGYWVWPPVQKPSIAPSPPVDVVFVLVGRTDARTNRTVTSGWPAAVPLASEHWAVWRLDPDGRPPDDGDAEAIASGYRRLALGAERSGQRLAGVQIDYDSPTRGLPAYATFLRTLSRRLPDGARLSVTALLTWFDANTRVSDVLHEVDEFVPQFYDVRPTTDGTVSVAEPIDPQRWSRTFERCGVPYRIGISAFGRIAIARADGRLAFAPDVPLLDVRLSPLFDAPVQERTPAGEWRLTQTVVRAGTVGGLSVAPGDRVQILIPTAASVESAHRAARSMGTQCLGVVVFRWPSAGEAVTMTSEEVRRAITSADQTASATPAHAPISVRVSTASDGCATARCDDVYVEPSTRLSDRRLAITIASSCAVDYFLAAPRLQSAARLVTPRTLRVVLPAFHGERRLLVGRLVSHCRPTVTVVEDQP